MVQVGKEFFGTIDQIIGHVGSVIPKERMIEKLEESKSRGYELMDATQRNKYKIAFEVAEDFAWYKFESNDGISFKRWLVEQIKKTGGF